MSDADAALSSLAARLSALYPAVAAIEPALRDDVLARHAAWLRLPAGAPLFDEGSACQGFPLLLEGDVRVARRSADGRSLELYRVGQGELCVASAACLFGSGMLRADGRTTRDTELVVLTREGLLRWTECRAFREFVFGIFADRLDDLIALAEAVAFQRLDRRLAAALLGRGAVVLATHQSLADELGTVREIVTRLLRRLERAGLLRLGRERIDVVDPGALRALAAGAAGD